MLHCSGLNCEKYQCSDLLVVYQGVDLPDRLCVAVCGAAHGKDFMISVNEVKLEDKVSQINQ